MNANALSAPPPLAVRPAIVLMGVSGSGKSTLGAALSGTLGLPFVEGDALHDAHSVAKMRAGQPLEDADRAGWLDRIAADLHDLQRYPRGLIVACSALRRAYRDRLRIGTHGLLFLFLRLEPAAARQRVLHRSGHFMPASLIPSQFAALEPPEPDERDVVTLDGEADAAQVLAGALAGLRRAGVSRAGRPDPSAAP